MTDGNTYEINKRLNDQDDDDETQETHTELEQAEARIEELEGKLAKAVAIAKDAIETMECGPFFPDREGQRLLAALAELSKERSNEKGRDEE